MATTKLKVGDRVYPRHCPDTHATVVEVTRTTVGVEYDDGERGWMGITPDSDGDCADNWYTIVEGTTPSSPLAHQVGGDHYRKRAIQPIEYIMANGLPFPEGNVVKYVTRWKDKGGVADLKKARQYLDFLIEAAENAEKSPA